MLKTSPVFLHSIFAGTRQHYNVSTLKHYNKKKYLIFKIIILYLQSLKIKEKE